MAWKALLCCRMLHAGLWWGSLRVYVFPIMRFSDLLWSEETHVMSRCGRWIHFFRWKKGGFLGTTGNNEPFDSFLRNWEPLTNDIWYELLIPLYLLCCSKRALLSCQLQNGNSNETLIKACTRCFTFLLFDSHSVIEHRKLFSSMSHQLNSFLFAVSDLNTNWSNPRLSSSKWTTLMPHIIVT